MTNQEIADSFKCRSSKTGDIMAEPKGGSNLYKYNREFEANTARIEKYAATKNKETKTAIKALEKIKASESLLVELKKIKHIPLLGDTCITYLKQWLNEKLYGRHKSFTSKQTDKGIKTEESGITLIALTGDYGMIRKNKVQFENEFQTGEPDIIVKKMSLIIDNKSSWSLDTFPIWSDTNKNKSYEWQVNAYCGLTGMKNAKICYTLNNMPSDMLSRQLEGFDFVRRKENESRGIEEGASDQELFDFVNDRIFTMEDLSSGIDNGFQAWHSSHFPSTDLSKFIEIPKERRVKTYDVEVSDEKIESIYNRVIECRAWILNTLNNKDN